jgi:hypothetical protein
LLHAKTQIHQKGVDTLKATERLAIADIRKNICQTCAYATRQDNSALVDCYYLDGNGVISDVCRTEGECSAYRVNQHLLKLKAAAIEAIKEFSLVNSTVNMDTSDPAEMRVYDGAAASAYAWQRAYAAITGLNYTAAALILHAEAKSDT